GDVTATGTFGRLIAVSEAGMGFGFLAVIIGYLPVLYQSFSRREINISLLDARAGSPPSAGQLLIRLASTGNLSTLNSFLQEWERWSAEVLESHLSFPMLCYYRSQHDNQSWLAALTTILDTCAVVVALMQDAAPHQAEVTLAIGRHAVVDLALVFNTPPEMPEPNRLSPDDLRKFSVALRKAGLNIRGGAAAEAKLSELRGIYEPFVAGLAKYFLFPLPPIFVENQPVDNWQTSAWMKRTAGFTRLAARDASDEHYE
ncbi:MAG: two pore domain potassium channel family protein, partial [Bryobacteraceae bacterium]